MTDPRDETRNDAATEVGESVRPLATTPCAVVESEPHRWSMMSWLSAGGRYDPKGGRAAGRGCCRDRRRFAPASDLVDLPQERGSRGPRRGRTCRLDRCAPLPPIAELGLTLSADMSEARIGRIVAAALHESLAAHLPLPRGVLRALAAAAPPARRTRRDGVVSRGAELPPPGGRCLRCRSCGDAGSPRGRLGVRRTCRRGRARGVAGSRGAVGCASRCGWASGWRAESSLAHARPRPLAAAAAGRWRSKTPPSAACGSATDTPLCGFYAAALGALLRAPGGGRPWSTHEECRGDGRPTLHDCPMGRAPRAGVVAASRIEATTDARRPGGRPHVARSSGHAARGSDVDLTGGGPRVGRHHGDLADRDSPSSSGAGRRWRAAATSGDRGAVRHPSATNGWSCRSSSASPSARTYWLGEGVAVLVADELERTRHRRRATRDPREALDELRLPTERHPVPRDPHQGRGTARCAGDRFRTG